MAVKLTWSCVVVLIFCATTVRSTDCTCDVSADVEICETLFRLLENALLHNGSNLFKLRNLLHTDPPELVNVTYHLEFRNTSSIECEADQDESGEESGSSSCYYQLPNAAKKLPNCSCAQNSSGQPFDIRTKTVTLRYGWTTIGVYTLIHPAALNLLQIQLPFFIMTNFGVTGKFPLLWNGRNQLPSINLYLSIPTDDFACIPANTQVDGVMKSLTSLVRNI